MSEEGRAALLVAVSGQCLPGGERWPRAARGACHPSSRIAQGLKRENLAASSTCGGRSADQLEQHAQFARPARLARPAQLAPLAQL